ncbi:hypothetical protein OEZ85_000323 [Tetradesmus obliquus]|uniref:Beta-lactamase-related domain-containing protein n=1 Tax=Tetradesmus obliquus TaxID=3088 RepID=A0ABY8UTE4_TETOB|nr:hypothetical protein OEZ85_000323 [Tetradesmus obliquus]
MGPATAAEDNLKDVITAQTPQSLERVVLPIPAADIQTTIDGMDYNTEEGRRMADVLQSDTWPNRIHYDPPAENEWRPQQYWWALQFGGASYKTPMRMASVSKPITVAVWANHPLLTRRLNARFFALWRRNVSSSLPEPSDPRIKLITVQQLIDHRSGFDNRNIGFDPALNSIRLDNQINDIIRNTFLTAAPGQAEYSYSNFGYQILARLAEGLTGRPWISLVRQLFPAGAPIFNGSDTVTVKANSRGLGVPGANEPNIYYNNPDVDGWEFDVSTMAGNGNLVSNVMTITWFGCQYRMDTGFRFTATRPPPPDHGAGHSGSMPGTTAYLGQWVSPTSGRVSAIAALVNTRPVDPDGFIQRLSDAMFQFMYNVLP